MKINCKFSEVFCCRLYIWSDSSKVERPIYSWLMRGSTVLQITNRYQLNHLIIG